MLTEKDLVKYTALKEMPLGEALERLEELLVEERKAEKQAMAKSIHNYLHWHRGEWCFSPKKFSEFMRTLGE